MKKILTLYLILSAFVSFAQNKTIDSLQQALKNYDAKKLELHQNLLHDENDTAKVNILAELSWEFIMVSNYATARKYADDALAIAQQINYKKGISNSYHIIGTIYYSQGNFPEALKNHFVALKIREETRDKKGMAASYNNIGLNYWQQGNYPEALKYYFSSLKIFEEIEDKNHTADSFNNIGLVYAEQSNYPEALKYYFASLKIKEETGDKTGIANSYGNIGIVYSEQGNYPEALKHQLSSLIIREETRDKNGIANSYGNIGNIYNAQGNYPEALKNMFAALKTFEEMGNKNSIAEAFKAIGITKLKMKAAKKGKDWLMKGLLLAKEIGAKDIIKGSYQSLAQADSALGNFKGAYENHKLFVLYRDSLINEENTKKTMQQQMNYGFEKREREIALLKSQQEIESLNQSRTLGIAFGMGGAFLGMVGIALAFYMQRNKLSKEKKISEQERMKSEAAKKQSEELLLNILPGEVADEIKNTGTAKAKAFTMVTVMFTDFKDFTNVSEKISAELLVDEIHTCFSAFDNILHKHRIEKIKTIGDAYLCASGLPVSNYTHAVDMLNAAFEIRSYMLQRKKEKEARGEIPFELRIGIHTGPVVAGIVGVRKYAYDIWGDTVNLAARMEQNSEAGKINISGSTYELVKDKFTCTHRGKIQAKNKGEIDMYFVEAFV